MIPAIVSVGIKPSIWSVKSIISRNCEAPIPPHKKIPRTPPAMSKKVPKTGMRPTKKSTMSKVTDNNNFNDVIKKLMCKTKVIIVNITFVYGS